MPLEPREVDVFNKHTSKHYKVTIVLVVIISIVVLIGAYLIAKSFLKYTLTYEANGGTVFGEEVEPDTYNFLDLTVEPEDVRLEGYYLEGWYKDKECTKKYTFGKPIWRSRTLYAKWMPGYAIVLNYASPQEEEKSGLPLKELRFYYQEYVKPNTSSSLPKVINYKDNYHKGEQLLWFETPECIGAPIEEKEYSILTEDINVYGKWYDTQEDKFEVDKDGVLLDYLGYCNRIILPDNIKEIKSVIPNEFMGGNMSDQQGNQQSRNFSTFKNVLSTLEIIYINDGMTKLGACSFKDCTALKSIVFKGDNVESFGENAFQSCIRLTSIDIPSKVSVIPNKCFNECTSLERVELTENVTTLEEMSFSGCISIDVLNLPGVTTIGKYALVGCKELDTLYLGSGEIITTDATNGEELFDNGEAKFGRLNIYVATQELADYYNSTSPWSDVIDWELGLYKDGIVYIVKE